MLLFKTYLFITRGKIYENSIKIINLMMNDEFELPDGSYSVSDTEACIKYIIKKHETLATIPPIHVYINRINNRLVFKITDGDKLELQTPETMRLFASTKTLIGKTKKGEKVPNLEVVKVVLVRCNLADNQYQQKSEVLYTSTPNKSNAYFLKVEPSNLVSLKIYNTELHEIIMTFTDQNG